MTPGQKERNEDASPCDSYAEGAKREAGRLPGVASSDGSRGRGDQQGGSQKDSHRKGACRCRKRNDEKEQSGNQAYRHAAGPRRLRVDCRKEERAENYGQPARVTAVRKMRRKMSCGPDAEQRSEEDCDTRVRVRRAAACVETQEKHPEAEGKGDDHADLHAALAGPLPQTAHAQRGPRPKTAMPRSGRDAQKRSPVAPAKQTSRSDSAAKAWARSTTKYPTRDATTAAKVPATIAFRKMSEASSSSVIRSALGRGARPLSRPPAGEEVGREGRRRRTTRDAEAHRKRPDPAAGRIPARRRAVPEPTEAQSPREGSSRTSLPCGRPDHQREQQGARP